MKPLASLVAKRFAPPTYATFFEVRNATGYASNVTRYADAISMCLWPSRGLHLHGFEFKTERSDWLRELADPAKAEAIATFCHRWWLVVSSAKIVLDGELPATWGLLVAETVAGKPQLRTVKDAPILKPRSISLGLVASLLRKATESTVPRVDVDRQIKEAVERERARPAASPRLGTDYLHSLEERHERLSKVVREFQDRSGIQLHEYTAPEDAKRMGQIVHALSTRAGRAFIETHIKNQRTALRQMDAGLTQVLKDLKGLDSDG